jgi:hypothetical protein
MPAKRPDSSASIVAAGEMARDQHEPATSTDGEDLAAFADSFGFDVAPHGPGGQ